MPETEDLYEILQVHPSAQPEIIKAAYRKLAQLYHPDGNTSTDSTAMMTKINHAYEMLSNPKRRAAYDETRTAHVRSMGTVVCNRSHSDTGDESGPTDEQDLLLAEAFTQQGWQCLGSNEHLRAIEHFNTAIALDPNNARAFSGRARAFRYFGEYRQTIADLTETIRLDLLDNIAYRDRGTAHSLLGECHSAIENLNVAISLDPSDAQALTSRGIVHQKLGEPWWAIEDMNEAIGIEPDNFLHYFMRGFVWRELGIHDLAEVDFETANTIDL